MSLTTEKNFVRKPVRTWETIQWHVKLPIRTEPAWEQAFSSRGACAQQWDTYTRMMTIHRYFQIKPEMRAADSMVTESVHSAYSDDESPASPAISNDVNSPEEIENNFGTTTYSKAGSVIRMMHHLLGDKAFRFGLQHYLKEK